MRLEQIFLNINRLCAVSACQLEKHLLRYYYYYYCYYYHIVPVTTVVSTLVARRPCD